MNSTRRFVVRTGSAVALLVLLVTAMVRADSANYSFANQTLTFSHLMRTAGGTAVGVNDPGFRSLLKSLGATLTWHPGERYVLIATPQPVVLNFAVGQKRYDMGLLSGTAAFAPFVQNNEVFLPFDDLIHALSLAQKDDGGTTVLQPQLTSVDVQGSGAQAIVVAHAAVPLHPHMVSDTPDRVVYEFDGVASSIDGSRDVNAGGIRTMQISTSGSVRDPHATVVLSLAPNTRHDVPHSNSGDFEVGFGANGGAPPLVASSSAAQAAQPLPPPVENQNPAPSASAGNPAPADTSSVASVTAVQVQQNGGGSSITVAVSGNASYEWHRLREPDNRFWIDIKSAQLQSGPRDEAEGDPLIAMRARQVDPQTVRIALSLSGPQELSVSPSATGIVITIGRNTVASTDEVRSGTGSIGAVVSANEPQTLVTPVPPEDYGQQTGASNIDNSPWKFGGGGAYVPTNPKLIVIDPGHGGGDRGAIREGVSEADVNLDMAKRLRDVLISRGWQVLMTRTDDHDVLATPKSSAEAEQMGYHSAAAGDLQARDDIANRSGARLFVSIHSNSFINSGPNGTTTYYSKSIDVPLAHIVDRDLVPVLGTKDDGTIKAHYYVTLHANMPAILIETAFLSNPDDLSKLSSPEWRQKVAEGIANGIDHYTAQYPVSGSAQ